jgi:mannosyltransferase
MLQLSLSLRARGHDVEIACPEAPEPLTGLAEQARAAGVAPSLTIDLARGVRWRRDTVDVTRLRERVVDGRFDLVHTWHTRDHLLALRALGLGRERVRLVRTHKGAEAIPRLPWNRWLFGPGTDGLLCVSPRSARRNAPLRGDRPLLGTLGAVDLERFSPAAAPALTRASLGLEPDGRVIGVVARAQRHRRFDLLMEAAAELLPRHPSARLLVIGRGTNIRETAEEPARRLGIADRVVFAGYRSDDYVDVLRCVDVLTFLVPGSDGGCRALLEAQACGIPAVVTRRGALPEIVRDGETGLVVGERVEALAAAWQGLLSDDEQRGAMARAARQRAEKEFAPDRLAADVEGLYRSVLS